MRNGKPDQCTTARAETAIKICTVERKLEGPYRSGDYPNFKEFVSFISKEARIACNPVSSRYALMPVEEKPTR